MVASLFRAFCCPFVSAKPIHLTYTSGGRHLVRSIPSFPAFDLRRIARSLEVTQTFLSSAYIYDQTILSAGNPDSLSQKRWTFGLSSLMIDIVSTMVQVSAFHVRYNSLSLCSN